MHTEHSVPDLLEKEGVKVFDEDIRHMTAEELKVNFRFTSSPRVNATGLIKSLIWQAYVHIKNGTRPPVDGNIRSFWYTDIKPVLARTGLDVGGRRFTERVYDQFVEFVMTYHLFHYRDFGFLDEGEGTRTIGRTNVHVILFGEKQGLYPIIRELAEEVDCVGVTLNGYASVLATEYLVAEIETRADLNDTFQLFSVVDYDPGGYWVAKEFADQLRTLGLERLVEHRLITPERLASEKLVWNRIPLNAASSRVKNWLVETGGIDGEAFGLQADAFGKREVRAIFHRAAGAYLKPVPKGSEGILNTLDRLTRLKQGTLSLEELADIIVGLSPQDLESLQRQIRRRMQDDAARALESQTL